MHSTSGLDRKGLRLSPRLWDNGRFPAMDDYRKILRRGCLLYSLDASSFGFGAVGPAVAGRPCNLLYHTATENSTGYSKPRDWGFKGAGRNEWLKDGAEKEKTYVASIHAVGIPVLIYQNENNFDESAFNPEEVKTMDAELDPFAWAFSNPGRRFSCLNKPAWRTYLVERLKIRVGDYGADGVFLDNNTPFIHCRCGECRRLYAERHGGADLDADMGRQETVVADMRVFDYVGMKQIPKNLPRLDDPKRMRYFEWRVERLVDFYRFIRERLETTLGRKIVFTANGHVAIAEQTGTQLSRVFDMHFSEDGFTAPPVSNSFIIRVGTALGEDARSHYSLTRTMESTPVADMVSVLACEGRAMGGSGEFWDFNIRFDDRLMKALKTVRKFFVKQADRVFAVEKDMNDTALLYSWRSDLWTGQAVSPARYASDLLEDINQPYDVLFAERDEDLARLAGRRLLIVPHVEILPDRWFDAIQKFLDVGGQVVSTGNAAKLNETLQERSRRWTGGGWTHFEQRVERDYALGRKEIGIHHAYQRPTGPWVEAVDRALAEATLRIEPATALLAVNHTRLPRGETVHIVNRHVNIFPRIALFPRPNLSLLLAPRKPARKIEWLSPTQKTLALNGEEKNGRLHIALPTLEIYGIVRISY